MNTYDADYVEPLQESAKQMSSALEWLILSHEGDHIQDQDYLIELAKKALDGYHKHESNHEGD